MNSLIVYGNPGFTFDEAEIFQTLKDLPGVHNLAQGCFVGAVLQCDYQFKGDRTTARLSDDLATITIAGTGDASLQMALELQQRETQPLFVTDFGYDYNFSLKGLHSLEEIKKNIIASADVAAA